MVHEMRRGLRHVPGVAGGTEPRLCGAPHNGCYAYLRQEARVPVVDRLGRGLGMTGVG
jgi:hypothetical protein